MRRTRFGSYLVGELPEGCRLCTKGAKLVLFVTGLCDRRCFYCPLSPQRKGLDAIYANERPVRSKEDVLEEARLMDALGTGMTGGDPLKVPDRTLDLLTTIKAHLGREHHVHLYTAQNGVGHGLLSSLKDAGLDELRFHATRSHRRAMAHAADLGIRTGVEIPAIPGEVEQMKKIAQMAQACGCTFLNLNELEMCETTSRSFRARDLRLINEESMAIAGSLEAALEVAEFCEDHTSLNVHVCPSRLKDAVQLRNRLGRLALNVRKPHERVDEDNLLVRAVVVPRVPACDEDMARLAVNLCRELGVDADLVAYNPERNRIETLPELAEDVALLVDESEFEVALTEEYPTWDRLETERRPINRPRRASDQTY